MIVYKITSRVDGKVYIGQFYGELAERRLQQHVREAKRGGERYLCRAMRKHGFENFQTEVIHRAETKLELNAMETFFIVLHQSHKPENGYNMTLGGEGSYGRIPSTATKNLWSKQRKGRPATEIQLSNLAIGWKRDSKLISKESKQVWQRPERRAKLAARTQIGFEQALIEYLANPKCCEICSSVIVPLSHQKEKRFVTRLRNRNYCSSACSNRARIGEKHGSMPQQQRQAISLAKRAKAGA